MVSKFTTNQLMERLNTLISNVLLTRSAYTSSLLDPDGRDLDTECGYPKGEPSIELYRQLYDREGIATRVVNVYPNECWSLIPELYETEKARNTTFEKAWKDLEEQPELNPWYYLHLLDEQSGIGRFGALLLGLDDGLPLDQPVSGIDNRGQKVGNTQRKLLYMRVFPEDLVTVESLETDPTNPRYGRPTYYRVRMTDPSTGITGGESIHTAQPNNIDYKVHWSRIIHAIDNRKTSPVYGVPRMRPVLNRLFDIRKVLGGSAEMFWRGAFPGYSFETLPDFVDTADLDEDSVKEQFEDWANGLKRYMALKGVTAKSLAPQISDPTAHINQQLLNICSTIEVPLRVFMGSESGLTAGEADAAMWNRRVRRRQLIYITPMIIYPFVDRLMKIGVLPEVKRFIVSWADISAMSDKNKADYGLKTTQALLQYVTSGAFKLMRPKAYFTLVLRFTKEEADGLLDAVGGEDAVVKALESSIDAKAGMTPQGSNTNPDEQTGSSGQRNGLGSGNGSSTGV